MSTRENLAGLTFCRLTVVAFARSEASGNSLWRCVCSCGKDRVVRSSRLKSGETKSCGCWAREMRPKMTTTHGQSHGREYSSWCAMTERCGRPRTHAYDRYGGRGIKVCDRWLSFENFFADMGPRPPNHSLDRINKNGNYEPGNCRWASHKQQARNTSGNRLLDFRGEKKTAMEWSEILGLPWTAIYQRVGKLGWSTERALTTPPRKCKRGDQTGCRVTVTPI